jgi:hypothetical protein
MNRNDLISRLVARKMSANGPAKAGCVPCFGRKCSGRKLCWVSNKRPAAANPKR